jgi:hypothetical protein
LLIDREDTAALSAVPRNRVPRSVTAGPSVDEDGIVQPGFSHRRQRRDDLDMVTVQSTKLMNLDDYGIAPGLPADLVVLDCTSGAQAVAELVLPMFGLKAGRRSFIRPLPTLLRPS